MADKSKTALPPPPPAQPNPFLNMLQGVGRGITNFVEDPTSVMKQPVAQSRITRTPIYEGSNMGEAAGLYQPTSGRIFVNPNYMHQNEGWNPIAHETAHAIFQQGAHNQPFVSQLSGEIPTAARWKISEDPQLYPPQAGPKDMGRYDEMMASEGLGYSIGMPWATPYVEKVAARLNPVLGAQLMRLHNNAVAVYNLQNPPAPTAVSK